MRSVLRCVYTLAYTDELNYNKKLAFIKQFLIVQVVLKPLLCWLRFIHSRWKLQRSCKLMWGKYSDWVTGNNLRFLEDILHTNITYAITTFMPKWACLSYKYQMHERWIFLRQPSFELRWQFPIYPSTHRLARVRCSRNDFQICYLISKFSSYATQCMST